MSRRHNKGLSSRLWGKTRLKVFDRDGWRCVKCGRPGHLEADHIEPLAFHPKQNPHDLDGLQTLCRDCHLNKTSEEFSKPDPARDAWKDFMAERLESITSEPHSNPEGDQRS